MLEDPFGDKHSVDLATANAFGKAVAMAGIAILVMLIVGLVLL